MSEKSTIDYDLYGHCCSCHRNMLIEQVVDMKVTKRLSVDYCEVEVVLDDQSKMRIAMCRQCRDKLTDKHLPEIMDCVIKGWQREVNTLDHWDDEKKKKHMDQYSKRKILRKVEQLGFNH